MRSQQNKLIAFRADEKVFNFLNKTQKNKSFFIIEAIKNTQEFKDFVKAEIKKI